MARTIQKIEKKRVFCQSSNPLDTGGSNNVDIKLFQRQRRRNNVMSTPSQPPVKTDGHRGLKQR